MQGVQKKLLTSPKLGDQEESLYHTDCSKGRCSRLPLYRRGHLFLHGVQEHWLSFVPGWVRPCGEHKQGKKIDSAINNAERRREIRNHHQGGMSKCGRAPESQHVNHLYLSKFNFTSPYSFRIQQVLRTAKMNKKPLKKFLEKCWDETEKSGHFSLILSPQLPLTRQVQQCLSQCLPVTTTSTSIYTYIFLNGLLYTSMNFL